MRTLMVAALAATFCSPLSATPLSGQPDPGFGIDGAATAAFDLGGARDDVGSLLTADAGGRLYAIGTVSLDDADSGLGIARFLPDGAVDAGFGIDGRIWHDVLPGGIELIATDAIALFDGALLLAGYHELGIHPVVCRFDPQGAPDPAFGAPETPGCQELDSILALDTQQSGSPDVLGTTSIALAADRIYVAAQTVHDTLQVVRVRVAQVTLSGAILPFDGNQSLPVVPSDDPGVGYWLSDILLDAKGRLVVTGAFAEPNDLGTQFYVARLDLPGGSLDASFGEGGIRTVGFDRGGSNDDVPATLTLLPLGRIAIAGSADTDDGFRPALAVLEADGAPSPLFNGGNPAVYNPCVFYFGACRLHATGLAGLPNRKILLAGYAVHDQQLRGFTLRLGANGMPDSTYGVNFPGQSGVVFAGLAAPNRANALVMQGDRPVLGGWRDTQGDGARDFLVTRLQP